jgi:hypothetical protein
MRLFHFSDEANIKAFNPRPVQVPVQRREGQSWLNGPLVWSIDDCHEPLYLFPRECPRILVWATPQTRPDERVAWFGAGAHRAIAHIERRWLGRLSIATIHRYELPPASFEPLGDIGMWVSRVPVRPIEVQAITDLPARLESRGVELRLLETLSPLKDVWSTSLHASGLRLRNAEGWGR